MLRVLCTAIAALVALTGWAQPRLDTLYYDRTGHGVSHKEFADYYRIVLEDETTAEKRFRDFAMDGRLMTTGRFLELDKRNDRNSKFEGTVTRYTKEGEVCAIQNYKGGLLEGLSEEFFEDGTQIRKEYRAGLPTKEFYVRSDKEGNTIKVRYADESVIWDSPLPSEITEDYHEGKKWRYYSKNGVTVALNTDMVQDYGKYHALNITIVNNSLVPIDFEPSNNITATSIHYKKNTESLLKVYSCEDYLRRFDKRNAWMTALLVVSETVALLDDGTSEQKSVTIGPNGERSVTHTTSYNPTQSYLTWELAHMRNREHSKEVGDNREIRRVGYFKRSTIYPGEAVSGFAYVQRIKGDQVTIVINIEGALFPYTWNIGK